MAVINSRIDRITSKSKQKELYSDFARTFELNPVTGSLLKLTNVDAVKSSLYNLIFTNYGERFYRPRIGASILWTLFELNDELTIINLQNSISNTIKNNEPRVSQHAVEVKSIPQDNSIEIKIIFSIVNIPNSSFQTIIIHRIR